MVTCQHCYEDVAQAEMDDHYLNRHGLEKTPSTLYKIPVDIEYEGKTMPVDIDPRATVAELIAVAAVQARAPIEGSVYGIVSATDSVPIDTNIPVKSIDLKKKFKLVKRRT